MNEINSSEFKAKCLALLDEVQRSGKPLRILKRGRPVAILYPSRGESRVSPQETLRGTVIRMTDIIEPVLSESELFGVE